ncbi:unnamed protein product [Effrenium voratum]|nr:unnamed protein product [Effrenium voratum]
MGNCGVGGVDDEEVQLRGCCKSADGELDKWKAQALSERPGEQGERLVSSFPSDSSACKKEALARLVKSFAHGRQLDVSSFNGSGQCEVRFDEKLTQMTLVPITGQGEWSVPLICVIDAKVDSPPGLGRYSLNASVRLRVGPHSGRGPDTLLLQLGVEEGEAMCLLMRAAARHLQKEAAWERQRAMDDESVATTMIRTVPKLQGPLADLLLNQVKRQVSDLSGKQFEAHD